MQLKRLFKAKKLINLHNKAQNPQISKMELCHRKKTNKYKNYSINKKRKSKRGNKERFPIKKCN